MCIVSIFISNYAYILFHGFYVINLVRCHCNRFTGHMASGGVSLEDDAICRKREEYKVRKGKKVQSMKATSIRRPQWVVITLWLSYNI